MAGAFLLFATLFTSPGPYVLVNGTGTAMSNLSIRPADNSGGWQGLGTGSLVQGARASMPAPPSQLCAFDIRATVGGTPVTWSSVNLCDVRVVTLNRRTDGTLWVDYD